MAQHPHKRGGTLLNEHDGLPFGNLVPINTIYMKHVRQMSVFPLAVRNLFCDMCPPVFPQKSRAARPQLHIQSLRVSSVTMASSMTALAQKTSTTPFSAQRKAAAPKAAGSRAINARFSNVSNRHTQPWERGAAQRLSVPW